MELKDFVSQTLTQIIDGVSDAQAAALQAGAQVNPYVNAAGSDLVSQGMLYTEGNAAQVVKFDVALTVSEGTGTKGGIGVFAGAVNLGSAGQSQSENSSVSRVQFSVPVILPRSSENAT
jgi:hypothetical protein